MDWIGSMRWKFMRWVHAMDEVDISLQTLAVSRYQNDGNDSDEWWAPEVDIIALDGWSNTHTFLISRQSLWIKMTCFPTAQGIHVKHGTHARRAAHSGNFPREDHPNKTWEYGNPSGSTIMKTHSLADPIFKTIGKVNFMTSKDLAVWVSAAIVGNCSTTSTSQ